MGLTLQTSVLSIIGIIYSALALTLAVIQCFFFKIHSRALDYIQWGYLMAVVRASVLTIPFSGELKIGSSLIQLSQDALSSFYCTKGSYVCLRAFALSFIIILVGLLVIMRFITIPEKVREKGITFPRVYRLFKGLFKWVYLPLMFQSIYYLIMGTSQELIPSVVILAALIGFPIVQVILYKKFDQQTEDPYIKWLQFANYVKAALFALFVVLTLYYSSNVYLHYVDLLIVGYAVFFFINYTFKYEVPGRVLYVVGEVIFYFLFSLYAGGSSFLTDYYLDLFLLGAVIVIDIIYSIMELVVVCRTWRGETSGAEVIPEESTKKRYQVPENLQDSKDDLQGSTVLNSSSVIKKKIDSKKKIAK